MVEVMYKIVLLRHGESEWNAKNLFCGWTDVDLTERGENEAKKAGEVLKEKGYEFDLVYTSVLLRATRTTELVMKAMGSNAPIVNAWQLNERHYGSLQGLNKVETAQKYGEDKVFIWRRSFSTPPPALTEDDERYPGNNPLFKDLSKEELPLTESLKEVIARVLPYWGSKIVPEIKSGKKILISAHGNSLRALVKYLDDVPEDVITKLNIPYGIPLVYELDEDLKPIKHYYLGDPEDIKKIEEEIANKLKA